MAKWDVPPRPIPNMRAQFQMLADEREALLGRRTIDPREGLPEHVAPYTMIGGDIPEYREEKGR